MKFIKGQKVRLNNQGIKAHIRTGGSTRITRRVLWSGRVGIIDRLKTNGLEAYVVWAGNKYPADSLAVEALELVEDLDVRPNHHHDIDLNLRCVHCPYRNNNA